MSRRNGLLYMKSNGTNDTVTSVNVNRLLVTVRNHWTSVRLVEPLQLHACSLYHLRSPNLINTRSYSTLPCIVPTTRYSWLFKAVGQKTKILSLAKYFVGRHVFVRKCFQDEYKTCVSVNLHDCHGRNDNLETPRFPRCRKTVPVVAVG